MKTCCRCGQTKEDRLFRKRRGKYENPCLRCHSNYNLKKRQEDPVKTRRQAYKNGLKTNFGMTPEDWQKLYEKQNGLCAVCNQPSTSRLHVDHCHETGEIRGLLCGKCNRGLGMFADCVDRMASAIRYITQFKSRALSNCSVSVPRPDEDPRLENRAPNC